MIRKFTFILISTVFITFNLAAQEAGFTTITHLTPESITANTGEKPQSKPWKYDGKWWAVFPNSSGTHLWRLEGTKWTEVLKLSSRTTSHADCKAIGSTTHILLYQGPSSQMASVEYDHSLGTYKLWSKRTSTVGLTLDKGVETATIDVDSKGRMWLASAGVHDINVRWSDSPYNSWSAPITIATGVQDDDICAVIALQGKIGVLWSNLNTQRFGFKTHVDGADPAVWSADEVPASQSALNVGGGMADDHLNMALASDGTLYCAVKTEYDTKGYTQIGLMIRRPSGTWDNMHEVSQYGTRPIVILNESKGKLKVVYTSSNDGGNILYKESSTSNISFTPQLYLIRGTDYNNPTSTKDNYTSDIVILASNSSQMVSVLASDGPVSTAPSTPLLASPANGATSVSPSPILSWEASSWADNYQAQVSTSSSFSTTAFGQSGITSTSVSVEGLAKNTTYYWRVRAANAVGTSAWSETWSFTTVDDIVTQPPTGPLVAHYKMDEGGGSTLVDASGYGNHATTANGPTWVAGTSDMALQLNGKNQYAIAPDHASLDIANQITLTAWIKPSKRANQYLIHKADNGTTDGYELSLTSAGIILFRINEATSGEALRVNSANTYPADGSTWVHVAATYDGKTARLYVNGVENRTKNFSSTINTNSSALAIGAQSDGFRSFNGAMDDVRVYNIALSASEVEALANISSPTAPDKPLLAFPDNASTGVALPPTLSWEASSWADSYQAQVSTSSSFSTTVFNQSGLSGTSATVEGLAKNTTYYWRVRAANAVGTSAWSETWSFTTTDGVVAQPSGPLVAHYKMNEGGGSTLVDASGYGNHATTANGPTWVAGTSDMALLLNGKNQYATAPDHASLDIANQITLAAWIKPDEVGTQYVLRKGVHNETDGYELSLSSGGYFFFRINQRSNGNKYRLDSSSPYPSDGATWVHVAATYDGSTARIYVNGKENSSMSFSSPISTNNLDLAVGAQSDGIRSFNGAMDDVRVYNKALTAEEISSLVINGSSSSGITLSEGGRSLQNDMEQNLSAYPNPFQSQATIRFSLEMGEKYTVGLFDSKGRLMKEITEGEKTTGTGNIVELQVDGSDLPKGLYLIRLQINNKVETLKLIRSR